MVSLNYSFLSWYYSRIQTLKSNTIFIV